LTTQFQPRDLPDRYREVGIAQAICDSMPTSPSWITGYTEVNLYNRITSCLPTIQQEPKKDLWLVLSPSAVPDIAAIRLMLNRRSSHNSFPTPSYKKSPT
jgi:hypothetical protein